MPVGGGVTTDTDGASRARGPVAAVAFAGLRAMSALGAIINGFALTYGFARIFDAHLFALFMFVGNLGVTLWLFDLGLARVLYVRLRALSLSSTLAENRHIGLQATSVVALYLVLVAIGAATASVFGQRIGQGYALGMFFAFCALNLPWYALRQISAAVDCFVGFEALEAVRRITHIGLIVSLPFGLPLDLCLLFGNAIWLLLLALSFRLLIRGKGLVFGTPAQLAAALITFLKTNKEKLLWSAGYVGSEFFSYSYPPILVPMLYGLGPLAIAFDTAYKVFRGTNVMLAAACEVAVPWQTRAHALQDRRGMILATLAAAALSAIPAFGVGALLILAGDLLFSRLLGDAAVVPHALSVLIAIMISANWLQTISNFALVYNGFFSAIARLALVMAALLSMAGLFGIFARPEMLDFAICYAVIYVFGAIAYLILALRLPLRLPIRRGWVGAEANSR